MQFEKGFYCFAYLIGSAKFNINDIQILYEPALNKAYNKTCMTSTTGVHVHPSLDSLETVENTTCDHRRLISLQAVHRGMNKNPCHIGWMYRLICLCWSYRYYCRFCHALAHMFLFYTF